MYRKLDAVSKKLHAMLVGNYFTSQKDTDEMKEDQRAV
jgi:hypothetical protein